MFGPSRTRVGWTHLLAAVAFTFNPFTATFLLPSVLFWNYAIAPWLLVAFLRGVRGPHPWRWAAVFALACFSAGNADLPGTAYAALLVVPAAVYVVRIERSASTREVLG